MAPEFKELAQRLHHEAVEASNHLLEKTREELERMLNEKNYAQASELVKELELLEGLPQELEGLNSLIEEILKKYGVASLSVPLDLVDTTKSEKPPKNKKNNRQVEEVREHHWRQREKYVAEATSFSISLVLLKDGKGKFVHRKLADVANLIILDNKYQSDAIKYVSAIKGDFAARIREDSEALPGKNMGQLIRYIQGDNLEKVKHPRWKELFEQIISGYGDLSPDIFISTCLNRFKEEPPPAKGVPRSVTTQEISPTLIRKYPVVELIVCGSLLREGTIAKIQSTFLGEKDVKEAVVKQGWESKYEFAQAFEASRQSNCGLRGDAPIDSYEGRNAKNIIKLMIYAMIYKRTGWHALSKEQPGLRFLYCLIPYLKHQILKGDQLLDILFPTGELQTDNAGNVLAYKTL